MVDRLPCEADSNLKLQSRPLAPWRKENEVLAVDANGRIPSFGSVDSAMPPTLVAKMSLNHASSNLAGAFEIKI